MSAQQPLGTELVRKVLDISTAHLPEETAQRMEDGEFPKQYSMHNEYGGLVSVPEEDEITVANIPCEALCTILRRAVVHGCDWVLFDRDGLPIEDLPVFDW